MHTQKSVYMHVYAYMPGDSVSVGFEKTRVHYFVKRRLLVGHSLRSCLGLYVGFAQTTYV